MFRLTRFLGPLIKMIQNMVFDISVFMVLFGAQMIVFASIGVLLFNDVDDYGDFYTACKTLFLAAMGTFDFTTLKDNAKGEEVGDIFMIIFVITNNILLLNLLIAILSSTYALLEEKKVVLYINEILMLRPSMEYNKKCSSLVSTFPPMNLIPLSFTPYIISKRNPSMLNNFIFHIEYIPIMMLFLIIFIAMHAILIPLAYLKGIFVHLQLIFNRSIESSLIRRILSFFIFLLFGTIILLLNFFSDVLCFIIH